MNSLKTFLPLKTQTIEPEQEDEKCQCLPTLTFKERLMGFAMCYIIGMVIQLGSFGSFAGIMTGHPTKFALTLTLGNIISIIGLSFLTGFRSQLKNMRDKTRLYTSIIYVFSMIMTLISALVIKNAILTLAFVIIQICAYIWYSASYIPFARSCIKSIIKSCFNCK